MNLSLLVHSFDGYAHLWPGYYKSFRENWNLLYPESYWGSDIETENKVGPPFKMLYSGPGEWSDRLRRLLVQIPSDYILYMQEDHWPNQKPPDLSNLCNIMAEKGLLRLQISPIVPFYSLYSEENTLFFDVKSKYLVSHQPSIWKKSFLMDCLKPGETPWVNEYKGTQRLQQTGQIRDFIRGKIAIYPYDWYKHMCIKGKMVEVG
jgi:uncharacterized protein (DUF3820 family)